MEEARLAGLLEQAARTLHACHEQPGEVVDGRYRDPWRRLALRGCSSRRRTLHACHEKGVVHRD